MTEILVSPQIAVLAPEVKSFWERVAKIPGVEGLLVRSRDGKLHLWPVVDQPNQAIQDAIYQAEWALMTDFPASCFDFHILTRFGRPLMELISLEEFDIYLTPDHA